MLRTAFALMVASLIGFGSQAWGLEFTADRITKIDGRTGKANIYYRDNMWRIEHHSMGPVNVSIVRKDKQVVWLLLSRMKHFKTMPYNADQDLMVRERLDGEVSREEIGTETREGHPTVLYEVVTQHARSSRFARLRGPLGAHACAVILVGVLAYFLASGNVLAYRSTGFRLPVPTPPISVCPTRKC